MDMSDGRGHHGSLELGLQSYAYKGLAWMGKSEHRIIIGSCMSDCCERIKVVIGQTNNSSLEKCLRKN